jgi:A/G-specific adenine glycosylase
LTPSPKPHRLDGSAAIAPAIGPAADACFNAARPLLLAWFENEQRVLPWRAPHPLSRPAAGDALLGPASGSSALRSPYAVWISEVMLQQTQVATVIPYFERWLARFPDPASLARAPEEEVLRAWAGLGYYARARNLQKAAKALMERGAYPRDVEGWKALPGIGDYTAGAVVSLAFGLRAPILDGNGVRVFSRLLGLDFLPGEGAEARRVYWDVAARWADDARAGAVNEALMELGALVCVPSAPHCGLCPLAGVCAARRHGWEDVLPPAKPRAKIEAVNAVAVLVKSPRGFLVERRGPGAFLAGHDMFPLFLGEEAADWRAAFARRFPDCRLASLPAEPSARAKHSIMSKRYEIEIWEVDAAAAGTTWVAEDGLDERLTNALARKIYRARRLGAGAGTGLLQQRKPIALFE